MLGTWETGDWNIAHNPAAWEMMFNELPDANIGLEWEPCHQLFYLIDPMPQLIDWMPKIFHVHGFAGKHTIEQWLEDLPCLLPHYIAARAQGMGMFVAKNGSERIVIEPNLLGSPGNEHRLSGGQQQAHQGSQGRWPLIRGT